jgi:hypothetical protein
MPAPPANGQAEGEVFGTSSFAKSVEVILWLAFSRFALLAPGHHIGQRTVSGDARHVDRSG